ncbi:HAD-IIIC family phosphatase [bacterium]|nr:HAD-IIIC family phosphatase [bacterium]
MNILADFAEHCGSAADYTEAFRRHAEGSLQAHAGRKRITVVVVGDCLLWDVAVELQLLLPGYGVAVDPVLVGARTPSQLIGQLESLTIPSDAVVIYSPVTFSFSPRLASAMGTSWLKHVSHWKEIVRSEVQAIERVWLQLGEFKVTALVVNLPSGAALIEDSFRGRLSYAWTWPVRAMLTSRIRKSLTAILERGLVSNPVLVDERRFGSSWKAGAQAYNLGEIHPTFLASNLASTAYLPIVICSSLLVGRKLVVVDLDNTLWSGVMAEGVVEHFRSRQDALKRLKRTGVVLAVASKNDPNRLRWEECALGPADFVAMKINWQLKSKSVKEIIASLNLGPEAVVFIDDRADERDLVRRSSPGVLALDATDETVWRAIEAWTKLADSALGDRTSLYRERAARASFLREEAEGDDSGAELAGLGLAVELGRMQVKHIARAAELINRTNQFNINGVRIVEADWPEAGLDVFVAHAEDKFGTMGMVGVIAITADGFISHFVLSCRAFGFQVEYALLAHAVKFSLADERAIRGVVIDTGRNSPCREIFGTAGFVQEDDVWRLRSPMRWECPSWLTLRSDP